MRLIDGDDLYRKVVEYNGGAVDKTVAKRLIEQQPTIQRNSTQSNAFNTLNALNALDTIYRQAAIDALGEEPMVWCNENEYELGERNQWNSDVLAIKAVPSAQPNLQPTCNQLATDTISRQVAIDELIAMREHIDARMSVIGCTAYEMAIEALREPERKKGHWIRIAPRYYKCSECGVCASNSFASFCHRCGSDMRGDENV